MLNHSTGIYFGHFCSEIRLDWLIVTLIAFAGQATAWVVLRGRMICHMGLGCLPPDHQVLTRLPVTALRVMANQDRLLTGDFIAHYAS
jgi:hypothetical protein